MCVCVCAQTRVKKVNKKVKCGPASKKKKSFFFISFYDELSLQNVCVWKQRHLLCCANNIFNPVNSQQISVLKKHFFYWNKTQVKNEKKIKTSEKKKKKQNSCIFCIFFFRQTVRENVTQNLQQNGR